MAVAGAARPGIALLVAALACGPIVVIVGAKAARRRSRRMQGDAAARIAGGWDEYVDAAVDAGRDAPPALTRQELAVAFATPSASGLAAAADRGGVLGAAPAEKTRGLLEAWSTRSAAAFARERGFWRGVVATVSLRSFFRHVAPSPGRRKRIAERGKHRAAQPVRLT